MNKTEARFRYQMWRLDWWLSYRKGKPSDPLAWMPRGRRSHFKLRDRKPIWCPHWVVSLVSYLRGPYSHRCDFTDPQSGLLHGGKPEHTMTAAFDKWAESLGEEDEEDSKAFT